MSLVIEETVQVGAGQDKVWRLLGDPFGWRFWWPQCKSSATADRKPLRDGSQLELALRLGWLPVTLRPKVEVVRPPRALIWSGKILGAASRQAFYLEPRPNGTVVRERLTVEGGGLTLLRLLRLDRALAATVKDNLRGLKRLAERS